MNYIDEMGMELINIENQLKSMGLIVNPVHKNGFHYFTVQNEVGAQVYCQVDTLGNGYSISSKYKPSREHGSGYRLADNININHLLNTIIESFKVAYMHAVQNGFPKKL